MADPYKRARATALRLLKKYGQEMALFEIESTAYDPENPATSEIGVLRMCPAFGVVLPTSESTVVLFDQLLKTDPTITKNSRLVLLAGSGLTFVPVVGMLLRTGEGPYKITGNTPLDPQGVSPILFRLKCTLDTTVPLPAILAESEILGEGELIPPEDELV